MTECSTPLLVQVTVLSHIYHCNSLFAGPLAHTPSADCLECSRSSNLHATQGLTHNYPAEIASLGAGCHKDQTQSSVTCFFPAANRTAPHASRTSSSSMYWLWHFPLQHWAVLQSPAQRKNSGLIKVELVKSAYGIIQYNAIVYFRKITLYFVPTLVEKVSVQNQKLEILGHQSVQPLNDTYRWQNLYLLLLSSSKS